MPGEHRKDACACGALKHREAARCRSCAYRALAETVRGPGNSQWKGGPALATARYKTREREAGRNHGAAWQRRQKALSLCVSCRAPALLGQTMCATHRSAQRRSLRLHRYGLTEVEWGRFLDQADRRCQMCGTTDRRLVPDHDHGTNVLRGVLCWHCNVGIGLIGDSLEAAERAVTYLKKALLPRTREP